MNISQQSINSILYNLSFLNLNPSLIEINYIIKFYNTSIHNAILSLINLPIPPNYNLIQLSCPSCNNITVYEDITDIPNYSYDATLNCKYCQNPWLYFYTI